MIVSEVIVSEVIVSEVIVINDEGPPYFEGPPQWVIVIVCEVIVSDVLWLIIRGRLTLRGHLNEW